MRKANKTEVDYSRGHKDSHCGKACPDDGGYCRYFIEPLSRSAGDLCLLKGGVVLRFGFGRRNVADWFKQPTIVEPVDPFRVAYSTALKDRHGPRR